MKNETADWLPVLVSYLPTQTMPSGHELSVEDAAWLMLALVHLLDREEKIIVSTDD